MNDFDRFIEDTTKPISRMLTNKDTVKNSLPSSKRILIQLNKFSVSYPDIILLLRSNLWRITIDPTTTLSSILPLDVWNHIDMYLSEERLQLFIVQCKKYSFTIIKTSKAFNGALINFECKCFANTNTVT